MPAIFPTLEKQRLVCAIERQSASDAHKFVIEGLEKTCYTFIRFC